MRILVIEDEPKLATLIAQGLAEWGYASDIAHDGKSGLTLAVNNHYDIIILDIMLPKMDGFALCRELRARGSNTPILMLTARDSVRDRVAGLDSGADDYLIKPFAFSELLARIRALLRRESGSRDPILHIGDLSLDPLSFTVRRGRRLINLTTKEFAILEFLMRNNNTVLSRTQIAEHVWSDFSAESNVIDVYISTLRRKLTEAGEPNMIYTIRGIGYQIRAASSP